MSCQKRVLDFAKIWSFWAGNSCRTQKTAFSELMNWDPHLILELEFVKSVGKECDFALEHLRLRRDPFGTSRLLRGDTA